MIHKLAAPASRSLRPLIEMNTFESAFTNEGAIANCLRRGPVVLSMLLIGSSIALAQLAPVPSTPGRQRTVTVPVQPQSVPAWPYAAASQPVLLPAAAGRPLRHCAACLAVCACRGAGESLLWLLSARPEYDLHCLYKITRETGAHLLDHIGRST